MVPVVKGPNLNGHRYKVAVLVKNNSKLDIQTQRNSVIRSKKCKLKIHTHEGEPIWYFMS